MSVEMLARQIQSTNLRSLVTVRQIGVLFPIEGADAIEVAQVEGWKVVVKKGEFKVGDPCVYMEIDSFLPDGNPAWQFLVDKSSKMMDGKKGHKLRTIKLKGQISQGFVMPVSAIPSIKYIMCDEEETDWVHSTWSSMTAEQRVETSRILDELDAKPELTIRDIDFSFLLGVEKFEAPIPTSLQGMAEGLFPSFLRKSDQERCISGDSLIETETGPIKISILCSIAENERPRVLSFNHISNNQEFNRILGVSIIPPGGRWLKITTKSGKVLIVTNNHKIWAEDLGKYVVAAELVPFQKVFIKE